MGRPRAGPPLTCEACNRVFLAPPSQQRQYCSRRCYGDSKNSTPEHFWSRVQAGDPKACRLWTGAKFVNGYGKVGYHGNVEYTHRIAWMLTFGPIPEGLWVLHKCDAPACCNPRHLFLGTHQDNMNDMMAKNRQRRGTRLSDDAVHEIRRRYKSGEASLRKMAKELHVDAMTISRIVNRHTYRHVV